MDQYIPAEGMSTLFNRARYRSLTVWRFAKGHGLQRCLRFASLGFARSRETVEDENDNEHDLEERGEHPLLGRFPPADTGTDTILPCREAPAGGPRPPP
jgi:hypothetical protein